MLGRGLHALWTGEAGGQALPWDVVIVGTGYGGSMAATALAGCTVSDGQGGRRPVRLCVLERGQEMRPGDFPSRLAELPGHLRIAQQTTGEAGGQAEGLFDLRIGEDVMALVANGVGGGSLINAGVLLEPEAAELRRADFRTQVQALKDGGWMQRARRALGGEHTGPGGPRLNTVAGHPAHAAQPLAKAQAMQVLAGARRPAQGVPITVALARGPNAAGVELPACTLCGDCMTGCNIGAKDSLDVNLLRQAVDAGAQLFTGASVSRLRPWQARSEGAGGGAGPQVGPPPRWTVEVEHTRPDLQAREAGPLQLHAHHVILAAGTFGSTEILLRSRNGGLAVSQRLGERFSCNGDNIAAVHRLPQATEGCADETTALDARRVGPTITTAIAFEAQPQPGSRPFWLQEFSVPGALRRLFEETVTTGHAVHQLPQADLARHGPGAAPTADQEADPAVDPATVDSQAMARTLLVGLIGHDDADGVLQLPHHDGPALGTLRIHWPQARASRTLDAASAAVQQRVDQLRGQQTPSAARGQPTPDGPHWVPNPMWRLLPDALSTLADQPRGPVLTVHPLGGCPMGSSAAQGVVDALGRVFDGADPRGQALHPGLVVLDGAIVPESLGANPSLTISALALRAAEALRAQWGLEGGLSIGQDPAPTNPRVPPLTPHSPRAPSPPARPRPMGRPRAPLPGQAAPQPTRIAVIERLTGPVALDLGDRPGGARPWMVEWTLAYHPARLDTLTTALDRSLRVDEGSTHSRLRVYDAATWEARGLAGQADEWRHRHAVLEARLAGTLHFLHREDSVALQRQLRGLWAWARHRGGRDLYQRLAQARFGLTPLRRALGLEAPAAQPAAGLGEMVRGLLRTASRAGEVRRFDYHLEVAEVLRCTLQGAQGQALTPLRAGDLLQGHKRLTYAVAGNPWRQLTELQVTGMPGLPTLQGRRGLLGLRSPRHRATPGTLVLDPRFLASRQTPLLRIVDQQDQVQALAELAGFALMLLRLLASIHLWTFRKPDTPLRREPVRLPQPIPGLPTPQITEWVVAPARDGRPEARVRLTRYPPRNPTRLAGQGAHFNPDSRRNADADTAPGPPHTPALVMLHGYSVSGNTFTHESLRPSAAEWFHRQGRDVWVVDLRTSSGLPTATVPWTLEEVALVDIPAVLLHVRQVTGGPVDVLAHCIGCVMLSMALLSRPAELLARAQALDRPPPLSDPQQAVLAAFNGPAQPAAGHATPGAEPGHGPGPQTCAAAAHPHPTVRRLVLSQKGPVLRYTDANVLRGWFMQYAWRWLLRDGFQFRPSAQPGAAEQLLDRLLASLPYPDADWRVENPPWPWQHTPWTATRHRMDVLYGRDFEATGLRPATLEAIDDLFGPIHLDTVSQTIHFTQADQATDHTGAGDYVTPQRLRERWAGIETLALHGRDNGLADVFTQRLLGLHLGAAGVPFAARTFDGMGHQDLLIGKRSAQVFAEVERFLREGPAAFDPPAPTAPGTVHGAASVTGADPAQPLRPQDASPTFTPPAGGRADALAVRTPWLGPRLDVLDVRERVQVRVAAMPPLDAGLARLVLVPARRTPRGWRLAPGRFGLSRRPAHSREWQFVKAHRLLQPDPGTEGTPPHPAGSDGWLALMVYAAGEQQALPMDVPWPGLNGRVPVELAHGSALAERAPAGALAGASRQRLKTARLCIQRWLRATPADDIEACLVPRQALQRLVNHVREYGPAHGPHQEPHPGRGPLAAAPPEAAAKERPRLHLAVASCQYPHGPLDRGPAQASLQGMARVADTGGLDLALFLGDQVYADATAGLVDATRRDERYEGPHEQAQRAPGMRRVLARLPSVMLPDDHEFVDNWEPPPVSADPHLPLWRLRADALRDGRWGYWKYERLRPQHRHAPAWDLADKAFNFGGLPIYLADTRTGRSARGSTVPLRQAQMLHAPGQFEALTAWLCQHRHLPKVVATPSLLLPRRAEVVEDSAAAPRSDAWDGYPASLDRLLDFLLDHQIQHTVFISGDEHHALLCEVTLAPPAAKATERRPVRLTSVHSSPLYAPFPFANGHPADLSDEPFITAGGTQVTMKTTPAPPGDGWARVSLTPGAGDGGLEVSFYKVGSDHPH